MKQIYRLIDSVLQVAYNLFKIHLVCFAIAKIKLFVGTLFCEAQISGDGKQYHEQHQQGVLKQAVPATHFAERFLQNQIFWVYGYAKCKNKTRTML